MKWWIERSFDELYSWEFSVQYKKHKLVPIKSRVLLYCDQNLPWCAPSGFRVSLLEPAPRELKTRKTPSKNKLKKLLNRETYGTFDVRSVLAAPSALIYSNQGFMTEQKEIWITSVISIQLFNYFWITSFDQTRVFILLLAEKWDCEFVIAIVRSLTEK
jgi:hypothetical protein